MTRAIAGVVLMLAACGKSGGSNEGLAQPDPQPTTPVVAADAMTAEPPAPPEPPAKGVPNSAIESPPRKDWPCRFVQSIDDGGTNIATTFEYGTRTHCWIPADLAGSRGLVGCPDKQVQQNLENKVEMPESYSYDSDGHLTDVTTIATTFHYSWSDNLVRTRAVKGTIEVFTPTANGVEIKDGINDATERIDLDKHGHVIRYARSDAIDGDATTFTWKGARLATLKEIGKTKVEYDCKKPPKGS
jgi:hypothetical protein